MQNKYWANEQWNNLSPPETIIKTINPTSSTIGIIGQLYLNSSTNVFYKCTNINGNNYTWELLVEDTSSLEEKINNQARELERQSYDLYSLWLKNYYTSGSGWSPSVLGAKSLIFDGFLDNSLLNNSNSTGTFSTKKFTLGYGSDLYNSYPDGITGSAATMLSISSLTGGAYQNVVVQSNSNGVYWNGGGNSNYTLFGIRITFPNPISFTSFTIKGTPNPFGHSRFRYLYTSTDGTNFTQAVATTINMGANGIEYSYEYSFTGTNIKAVEIYVDDANEQGSGINPVNIKHITFDWSNNFKTKMISQTFTLPNSYLKAKLFISTNTQIGLLIKPYIGGILTNINVISNRIDPIDSNYREYEIDLETNIASNSFYLQLESDSTSITQSINILKYGIYFIE